MTSVLEFLKYLAAHDLPVWVTAVWTIVLLPLFGWWWNDRKKPCLPGLRIFPHDRRDKPIKVEGKDCPAIQFEFQNNTKRVLYLTDMEIVYHTKRFVPRREAAQNIADHSYELKFLDETTHLYSQRQIVIQTDGEAKTVLPVDIDDFDEFLRHQRSWWRTFVGAPRYFVLEFVAMEGTKRHRVRFDY